MLRFALNRVITTSLRQPVLHKECKNVATSLCASRTFASLSSNSKFCFINNLNVPARSSGILQTILPSAAALLTPLSRNLTKFSLNKGKRKSVKAVLKRFKRLHWGAWIRTRCGRHKKMWKKTPALKRRLRQHVFVNGQQAMLLDKMVTRFWRRPKYYIDDPYAPYHTREEFKITKGKFLF